jgi:hypothetical protein
MTGVTIVVVIAHAPKVNLDIWLDAKFFAYKHCHAMGIFALIA